MSKIKIVIADDQHLFREGLANLLQANPDYQLLAQAANGRLLLEQLSALETLPDIALIDMNMPEMNGVELNVMLSQHYPTIRVIVLSVHGEERYMSRMIEAGACGYLKKNCEVQELYTTINNTYQFGFYFNAESVSAMRNASRYRQQDIQNLNNIPITLTDRELHVLKLVCEECTNAEIAARLLISIRTVEGHRNNLLAKIGCKNTAGLVRFAIRYNIFEVKC
ncbi:two component transcriptional regulator, LuxR family [Chitinophaga costaii]|uniref:Two component transcriptional regulator, LuxR family n=1 Tax=Chitinophaga costaii TaxID=1335309 RepID=A0A1C4EZ97_9BACT|nr:response regulator transcription factor [Chitinophaga costaii]PUZ21538.1 DNA-binding response regulator [Chitinophaga costaii]SCC48796.1 two component transcriptional regulator, LuxR family [Chitinophaga costaii]